jgi:hypothetical protein
MPISQRFLTVDNPIPSWKGPEENGIDEILILQEDAPPISGAVNEELDFHCAETYKKDGGVQKSQDTEVVKYEKVVGTKYDDQG